MPRPGPSVRALGPDDQTWVVEQLRAAWGVGGVVSRGRLIDPTTLPGVLAESGPDRVGLATYDVDGDACELVGTLEFAAPERPGELLLGIALTGRTDSGKAISATRRAGARVV